MRYAMKTDLPPQEVLSRARRFFGDEWGLEEQRSDECSVTFEGGGGGVAVGATAAQKQTEVEVLAREWDRQARQFLREVDHG